MYVHSVYFTYQSQIPEGEKDILIADVYELLAHIPVVRKIDAGRRDPDADREVNDKDFHVGLTVYFDDKQGYDEYQVDEKHQAFVAKHKSNWASIRVYDFVS
ncbi:MAG: Dabb family protein [Planctomycetota bacterium]|nr:MAG: Dabb family protein [Planctomycetota bacterium]